MIVLLLTMEAAFGDCSEQITIGVPYYMIEPMVKSIQARRAKDTAPVTVHIPDAMSPLCSHITMPVRAEWPAFETPPSPRRPASLSMAAISLSVRSVSKTTAWP